MKKIITFTTLIICMLFGFFMFSVKADSTSGVAMANGASIRATGEKQGIKFTATVNSLENSIEHGFYIVIGDYTKDEIVAKLGTNNETLAKKPIKKIIVEGTTLKFHAVVYGVPESYYTQRITAIAYVKYENSVEYSDASIARSISDVAVKQHQYNYQNQIESPEIIQKGFDMAETSFNWQTDLEYTFKINHFENYIRTTTVTEGWPSADQDGITYYNNHGSEIFLDDPNGSNTAMTVNFTWYRILIKKVEGETGIYKSITATKAGELYSDILYPKGSYDYIIAAHFENTFDISDEVRVDRLKIVEFTKIIQNGGEIYFDFGSDIPADSSSTSWNKTVGVKTTFTSGAYPEYKESMTIDEANATILPTNENNPTGETLERVGYTFNGWIDPIMGKTITKQGISKVLVADWSLNKYKITYNNVEESEMPVDYVREYTYESEEIILPIPTKEGYNFIGWYKTYTDGIYTDQVTSIPIASIGDLTVYARFIEEGAYTVGEGQNYATIKEAVDAATLANDTGASIIVFPGTYSDDVEITIPLNIMGAQSGIAGTDISRSANSTTEAVVTGNISVNASDVEINGLAFSGTSALIYLGDVNNIQLRNLYMKDSYGQKTVNGGIRTTSICGDGSISNLVIDSCYMDTNVNNYRPIYLLTAEDLIISNNKLGNTGITSSASITNGGIDISVYNMSGYIRIINNDIYHTTKNYSILLGYGKTTTTCEEVTIRDNIIDGEVTCTICVEGVQNTEAVVHFVGNDVRNQLSTDTNLSFSNVTGIVNVKYNIFDETSAGSYKHTAGVNAINYANNYYAASQTVTGDYNSEYTLEQREIDYLSNKFYNPETAYTINYELDGGTGISSQAACIDHNIVLSTPEKQGYDFVGWVTEENQMEYLTVLNRSENTDITLYAVWKEKILTVGPELTDGIYYTSIQDAIDDAYDGATITVYDGTYEESITINKSVTIVGPNKGIAGTDSRNTEAYITGVVNITADDVTLDGLAFSGITTYITLDSIDNITLTNIYSTGYYKVSDTRSYFIYSENAVSNLEITDSVIGLSEDVSNTLYRPIYLTSVSDATISRNNINNGATTPYNSPIMITMMSVSGVITISDNITDFTTKNMTMNFGETSISNNTELWIRDNILSGDSIATIGIRNLPSIGFVHFIGNIIENSNTGNNFNFNGSTGVINIKYNNFTNCTYKLTYAGSNTTFANNFYAENPSENLASTKGGSESYYTNEYNANSSYTNTQRIIDYLSDEFYNPDTAYTITYDLNYGLEKVVQKACIGYDFVAPTAPTRTGYTFLGWYTSPDFAEEAVTVINQETNTHITLYAKWEEDTNITESLTTFAISNNDANIISEVKPNILVNPNFTDASFKLDNNNLTENIGYELNVNAYTNLVDALANAEEGSVIYLFAGTYSDVITIDTNYVTLVGPNYNVLSSVSERNEEAKFISSVSLEAHGVTINGIEIAENAETDDAQILFAGDINNITIKSIYVSRPENVDYADTSRFTSVIHQPDTYYNRNIVIDNCRFTPGDNVVSGYRPVRFDGVTTNIIFSNNYFEYNLKVINQNQPDTISGVYTDIIWVQNIIGTLDITGNIIAKAPSDNFFVNVKYATEDAVINIKNNVVKGISVDQYAGPIYFEEVADNVTINIIGNEFEYVDAYIVRVNVGIPKLIVVKYNIFKYCDVEIRLPENATTDGIELSYNYIENPVYDLTSTSGSNDDLLDDYTEVPDGYIPFKNKNLSGTYTIISYIENLNAFTSIEELKEVYNG